MKRSIKTVLFAVVFLSTVTGWAQNMWDAYRYSQQFSEGTARSVAMGNASVALGGDIGSISLNPASSGVYRFHEFTFTPSLTVATGDTDYLGVNTTVDKSRFGIPNFGYVGSFSTGRKNSGLINWNIAIAFNRTNNFVSHMNAVGKTAESSWLASLAQNTNGIYAPNMDINSMNDPFYNSDASWNSILAWNTSLLDTLPDSPYDYIAATENIDGYNIGIGGDLDQYYSKESVGNISEAAINFGGNISNKLFFGVNIGIVSIYYKYSEVYSERAVNPNQFQSGFRSFAHYYNQSTSGTGVNLKAGIIYLPVKGLRLGASISTPTWMYLNEEWDERIISDFTDGYSQNIVSPLGTYNYRVNTPFRWNAGVAYTIGQIAAISIDYENVNYSQMKLKDEDYDYIFAEENGRIKNYFKSQNIIRAGAEVKFLPQVAFRAGYQYYSTGYKYDNSNLHIGSLGFGYSSQSGFFADIAYQRQMKKSEEIFSLYDDITDNNGNIITEAPTGINKYGNWKLLLSVGLRF